ncbi:MAG: IS110 family transposase, partial [Candidatus Aminicenantes bacterium]|nr:IS110 family transposase [Candidatus Aminicenantes bacterium]NIT21765.1 IS110 family transposase [Candidatus Aminicenantes bacterium]
MSKQDISRVERFRQFKNQIRGSDRFLIVGLDIGKNMHHGFLGTAMGITVKRGLRVENSASGFEH